VSQISPLRLFPAPYPFRNEKGAGGRRPLRVGSRNLRVSQISFCSPEGVPDFCFVSVDSSSPSVDQTQSPWGMYALNMHSCHCWVILQGQVKAAERKKGPAAADPSWVGSRNLRVSQISVSQIYVCEGVPDLSGPRLLIPLETKKGAGWCRPLSR